MAHNPHAPQGSNRQQDPAGSTQMFRAFVDEGTPQRPVAPAPAKSRVGLIAAVAAAVLVLGAVVWLAVG